MHARSSGTSITDAPSVGSATTKQNANTKMLGFSGYGTNAYGSERQSLLAPVVKLAMRIVQNSYNAALGLMLRFRGLTLSNPETNERTLEL